MTGWEWFEQFLDGDPHDIGRNEAMAVLHAHVGLLATGVDAAEYISGIGVTFCCVRIVRGGCAWPLGRCAGR